MAPSRERIAVCADCGQVVAPIKLELLNRIIFPKRCDWCWKHLYKVSS